MCAALTFASVGLAREVAGPWGFVFAVVGSTVLPTLFPLQYLHIRAATGAPARIVWPHMLVPVSNLVLIAALTMWAPVDSSAGVVSSHAPWGRWIDVVTIAASVALGLYALAALRRLAQARRAIAFRSGARASRRLNWLMAWCATSFTVLCVAVIADLGAIFGEIGADAVAGLLVGCLALQVIFVGAYVAGSIRAFEPLPRTKLDMVQRDLETLSAYMRDEKPFLEAGLSAESLAEKLGWPAARLVPAIRAAQAAHFNDYLNRWRVEVVMQLVKDCPDTALLDLGFEAGFGSKSAFNDAFRRHTGLSPSEYRRRMLDRPE